MAMAAASRAATSRTPAMATASARFVQSRLRSSTTRVLAEEEKGAEKLSREEIGREIQEKKEALYDVIAKAEQRFDTRSFQNMRLLQILSVQVNPRPWDTEWRLMRFARRVNSVMEIAGFIALGGLADYGLRQYRKCLAAREALWAEVMMEEEQQEAREVMMET